MTITAEELAGLMSKSLLLPAGLKQAEDHVKALSSDSPNRERMGGELQAAKERWEREAPIREAREKLAKAGWTKSQYDPAIYVKKVKLANGQSSWIKKSLVEAIRAAGMAE